MLSMFGRSLGLVRFAFFLGGASGRSVCSWCFRFSTAATFGMFIVGAASTAGTTTATEMATEGKSGHSQQAGNVVEDEEGYELETKT